MSYREDLGALIEGLARHSTIALIEAMLAEIEDSRCLIASPNAVPKADALLEKIRGYIAGHVTARTCEHHSNLLVMSREFNDTREGANSGLQSLFRYQSACVDLVRIISSGVNVSLAACELEENLTEFKLRWMGDAKAKIHRGQLARLSARLDALRLQEVSSKAIESRCRLSTLAI